MATQPATVEYLLGVSPRVGDTRLGLADSIVSGLPVRRLITLLTRSHPTTTASNFVSFPKRHLIGVKSQHRGG